MNVDTHLRYTSAQLFFRISRLISWKSGYNWWGIFLELSKMKALGKNYKNNTCSISLWNIYIKLCSWKYQESFCVVQNNQKLIIIEKLRFNTLWLIVRFSYVTLPEFYGKYWFRAGKSKKKIAFFHVLWLFIAKK